VFLLEKSDVKLTLISLRLKVFGQNVDLSGVEESVNETTPNFKGVNIALEEVISFEHIDDFTPKFL